MGSALSPDPFPEHNRQPRPTEGSYQRQPHHPQISTQTMVHKLDKKMKEWNEITTNLIKEKDFGSVTREYIHTLMNETEKELHAYNQTLWRELRVREHDKRMMNYQHQNVKEDDTEKDHLKMTLANIEKSYQTEKKTVETPHEDIRQLKSKCKALQREKDQLILRLSKIAGEKLVTNNPNIADLSDPNRPTKLGEQYSELYDNEWTDAFDGLNDGGYDEVEAIEILRLTLLDAVDFCREKAKIHLKKSTELVDDLFERTIQKDILKEEPNAKMMLTVGNQRGPDLIRKREKTTLEELQLVAKIYSRWQPKVKDKHQSATSNIPKETMMDKRQMNVEDKFKKLRKEVALSLVPAIQKAYIKLNWNKTCVPSMKPYIKKCIFIGWLMVVQTPAMALVKSEVKDPQFKSSFDRDLYKAYQTSGSNIEYVVWPAILLMEGGPVIAKGVAECRK